MIIDSTSSTANFITTRVAPCHENCYENRPVVIPAQSLPRTRYGAGIQRVLITPWRPPLAGMDRCLDIVSWLLPKYVGVGGDLVFLFPDLVDQDDFGVGAGNVSNILVLVPRLLTAQTE